MNDIEIVGLSTILNMYHRMKPLVSKLVIISQGSSNPSSPWARARFNWIKQLAICFGKLVPTKFRDPPIPSSIIGIMPSTSDPVNHKVFSILDEMVDNTIIHYLMMKLNSV